MIKQIFKTLILLFCLVSLGLSAPKSPNTSKGSSPKTPIASKNTPFKHYELKGEEEGPTLLVIGGIHGDEPGGFLAPAILAQHYTIKKGNVIVVPNLNPDSILALKRGVYKDMNRKFAKIAPNDPDFDNVAQIKKMITDEKVDFIINLHDGHGFYREKWENAIFNPRAWGQTYVIDQKTLDSVRFGNLDEIAKQIEIKLNNGHLHYDFHIFGIRNTETRIKDEEQQNSLTFFAITHLKPALAIETSKNIKEEDLKVYYQLISIEALMEVLGISYQRDFEITREEVNKRIKDYGDLKINDNITLSLSDLRSVINFTPLKPKDNKYEFSHPLGRIKTTKIGEEIYIGHKKIATLKPDYFAMNCSVDGIWIERDKKEAEFVKFGETIDYDKGFLIKEQKGVRINIIGYAKKGVISEHNLYVPTQEISTNYSLDKAKKIFRIEAYEGKNFCGMVNAKAP